MLLSYSLQGGTDTQVETVVSLQSQSHFLGKPHHSSYGSMCPIQCCVCFVSDPAPSCMGWVLFFPRCSLCFGPPQLYDPVQVGSVLIGFHSVATALALQLVFQLECTRNPLPLHYLVFYMLQLNTAAAIRTRLVATMTISNVTISTAVVTVPRGTAALTRDTTLLKTAALKGVLLFWSCVLLPHDTKKNVFLLIIMLSWNLVCVLFPRTNQGGKNKLPTVLGSTLGTIFPLILIVGVIICCVAPCCFCYKKCRKGGNRGHQRRTHFWLVYFLQATIFFFF